MYALSALSDALELIVWMPPGSRRGLRTSEAPAGVGPFFPDRVYRDPSGYSAPWRASTGDSRREESRRADGNAGYIFWYDILAPAFLMVMYVATR